MKWLLVVGFFVCLTRFCDASALKCPPGSRDASCIEKKEKDAPVQADKGSEQPVQDVKEEISETECLAGTEWDSNCHYCRCSDSGVAECLRQDTCGDGVFTEPIRCKPNTTFQRDCNICTCLENGLGLCTLEFCRRNSIVRKSNLPEGDSCASGSTWKSQCNECHCDAKGVPACTDKACPGDTSEQYWCAPGSFWKNDCNTCWCTNGKPYCTRLGCNTPAINFGDYLSNKTQKTEDGKDNRTSVPKLNTTLSRKTRAPPQEPPKACQPGQEFRMDCNKCLCDNEGQDFSCTRIDCTALNNNHNGGNRRKRNAVERVGQKRCEPFSVHKIDCNTCRCTADGQHGMCTLKLCNQQNLPKEINASTDTDSNFRCNPGEQFKRDCNDCSCSADGKSVFCTLRLCDSDLTPTI